MWLEAAEIAGLADQVGCDGLVFVAVDDAEEDLAILLSEDGRDDRHQLRHIRPVE